MANIPGAVTDPSRVRGENLELKSGGDTITGYLARPSQAGNYPGIVVIHEAFGLVEHIRDIARRFANIGYNALAPDLYARAGGPSDPNNMATVMPVMFGKSDDEAVQDLEAAAAHLRALPGANGKIGAIGFCSGGRQTLLFACSRQDRCRGRLLGRVHPSRHPRRRDHAVAAETDPRPGRRTALPALRGVRRGGPEPVGARNPRNSKSAPRPPART